MRRLVEKSPAFQISSGAVMSVQFKQEGEEYRFCLNNEPVTDLKDPRIQDIFHRILTSYVYDGYRNRPDSEVMQDRRKAVCYLRPHFEAWAQQNEFTPPTNGELGAPYLEKMDTHFGYAGEELSEDSDGEEMPSVWESIGKLHQQEGFWSKVKRTRPRSDGLEKRLKEVTQSIDKEEADEICEKLTRIEEALFKENDDFTSTPSAEQKKTVEAINTILQDSRAAGTISPQEAERLQELCKQHKLYIVHYRGMNYLQARWNAPARRYHRKMEEVGRPQFAEMVLKKLNFNFYRELEQKHDYTQIGELSSVLQKEALLIREDLLKLRRSEPVRACSDQAGKELYLFNNELELWQHKYSNGVRAFLDWLKEKKQLKGNPFLSVASTPRHAMKYAYGEKDYYEKEMPLRPRYRRDGKLEYSHLGKVYISVHRAEDVLRADCPNHLPQYNAEGRVVLGNLIAPEMETSYLAYVNGEDIKYQFVAKFPSFHKRNLNEKEQSLYESRYGINSSLFASFKSLLTHKSPDVVKAAAKLLFEYLCRYNTVCFDQLVARQQEGIRVFIDEKGLLSWTPPKNALINGKGENQERREQVHVHRTLRKMLAEKTLEMENISTAFPQIAERFNKDHPKDLLSPTKVQELYIPQFLTWIKGDPLGKNPLSRAIQGVAVDSRETSLIQRVERLSLDSIPSATHNIFSQDYTVEAGA